MILERNDVSTLAKGWYRKLARPALPLIGFANHGIDEPHYHHQSHEVYLVARGSSTIVVDGTALTLSEGDVIVVEPGEVHTFVASTSDYFHFVLQCPPSSGDKAVVT